MDLEAEEIALEEEGFMITDFIDEVREDRAAIEASMHRLPESMRAKLSSREFTQNALSEFNGLDRDGNGSTQTSIVDGSDT